MSHWQQETVSRNLIDEAISADCAECCDLHASYVEGCLFLEEVEAIPAAESHLREVRDRVNLSRRAWLSAARRALKKPVHTRNGVMAKTPVVKGLLQEICGDDTETMSATLTFFDDLDRILRQPN